MKRDFFFCIERKSIMVSMYTGASTEIAKKVSKRERTYRIVYKLYINVVEFKHPQK